MDYTNFKELSKNIKKESDRFSFKNENVYDVVKRFQPLLIEEITEVTTCRSSRKDKVVEAIDVLFYIVSLYNDLNKVVNNGMMTEEKINIKINYYKNYFKINYYKDYFDDNVQWTDDQFESHLVNIFFTDIYRQFNERKYHYEGIVEFYDLPKNEQAERLGSIYNGIFKLYYLTIDWMEVINKNCLDLDWLTDLKYKIILER